MKKIKKPYTLYYESRYLRAIALLDQVEGYMEQSRDILFSDSSTTEEFYDEKSKEFLLLNSLYSASLRKTSTYESELEQLFHQEKLKNDFFEGNWEPEYY